MTQSEPSRPRPRWGLRALLSLLAVAGLLAGVAVAATLAASPEDDAVSVVAAGPEAEDGADEEPDQARGLSVFAQGDDIRAQAAEDEALAYMEALAAEEAAAAAAEQEAAEQAAAEEAAAEAAAEPAPVSPGPAPGAPPPPSRPTPVEGDPFDALAQCESGGNPQAVNPAGPWYGAFQFSQPTWNDYAPDLPGKPTDYSYGQQKTVAQRLQAARGWSPWPHCARQLGLL